MPPENNSNSSSNKKLITLVVVFVVLIALAFLMLKSTPQTVTDTGTSDQVTRESVKFEQVNLEGVISEEEKLPSGFPRDIPIETKEIFISDTKVYTDRTPNVTLYTVNYRTDKSVSVKYSEYLNYMTKALYSFEQNGKDEKNHALYGSKSGNTLLVAISNTEGKTVVQIVYTKIGN
ncbi:MAG TPA: hypothetical protein VJC12_02985 [Candidatus Paceibacterota bacterium]